MYFKDGKMYKKKSFWIRVVGVVICLCIFHPKELVWAGIIIFLIFTSSYSILFVKDYVRSNNNSVKKEKRTIILSATIVKVKRIEDVECDFVKLICKSDNGEQFVSDKIIERKKWRVGEKVKVYVEPNNYSNYFVDV